MIRRRRQGANVIEFALLLPVFLSVLLGFLDLSYLFYQRSQVHSAVSSGCRAASLVDPGSRERRLPAMISSSEADIMDRIGLCEDSACVVDVAAVQVTPARSLLCQADVRVPSLLGLYTQTVHVASMFRMEYQRYVAP